MTMIKRYACMGCDRPCRLSIEFGNEPTHPASMTNRMVCVMGSDFGKPEWIEMPSVVFDEAEAGTQDIGWPPEKAIINDHELKSEAELRRACLSSPVKAVGIQKKPLAFYASGDIYDVPTKSFAGIIPGNPAAVGTDCAHPCFDYGTTADACGCRTCSCGKCICYAANKSALIKYLKEYEA